MSRQRDTVSIPNTAPCQQMHAALQLIKKKGIKVGDVVIINKITGQWRTSVRLITSIGQVYVHGDDFPYHPSVIEKAAEPAPS